jgi:AcrR family transcriptional regulator
MGAVGLSGAALYPHFGSKAGLIKALLSYELDRSKQLFSTPKGQVPVSGLANSLLKLKLVEAVLTRYFDLSFVRDQENGCIMPSLSQEISHQETEVQLLYNQTLQEIKAEIAKLTRRPDLSPGIVSAVFGAVSIARAIKEDDEASAYLKGTTLMILSALNTAKNVGAD